MRDYKFRGKRKDTGEWVKGDLIRSRIAVEAWINTHNLVTRKGEFIQPVPVDPSTVGQYVGLKDRNDVEIYEDDIIDCRRSGDEEYTVHVCIDDIRDLPQALFGSNLLWCEAIGNIHDNPELLEDIIAKAREGEGK
ncbi:MAG: YopX family protein [Acetivibrionales bacterium]|jgi:hypothetical protein